MGLRRIIATAVVVGACTTCITTVTAEPAAAGAGADADVVYQPPVDAPVVDPFRVPFGQFGPGNRGLTYDAAPGSPVRASAAGEVVFAGPVAGSLHVTVLHADGLRSSYSFLESVAVRRGQAVDVGTVVGTGGAGFHFGVRDGTTYLDPAALFGGVEIRVRLIPHEEPLPPTDAGLLRERLALQDVVDERNAVQRFLGRGADLVSEGVDRLRAGAHLYGQLSPVDPLIGTVEALYEGWGTECTDVGASPPSPDAAGRVALLVAGYGSDSEQSGIDQLQTETLGYRGSDVVRYSYAGGRTPDPDGDLDPALAGIPARPYGPADTFGDLVAEGNELADLIEDVASTRPGTPVDLYAHSQGGLVVRLALLALAQRAGGLDALGTVVTIGTPHSGTDLASVAQVLDDSERQSVDLMTTLSGAEIDPSAVSVGQMAETSDLVGGLRRDGVPSGVDFRTIGARGDLVVTGDHTRVDGHPSAMLDLFGPAAHEDLPGSAGTTTEIALALEGRPPSCRSLVDQVLDAAVPNAVSFTENAFGAGYVVG